MTLLSINQVQKLGDVSCILEQFPAETNAGRVQQVRHLYVVLSEAAEAEMETEQRGQTIGGETAQEDTQETFSHTFFF